MTCRVSLVSYTSNAAKTVAAAARLCYSDASAVDLLEGFESQDIERFITHLHKSGHLSPFEHAQFVFAVDGISRIASHQLVRHRIASFSQQSQRYVEMGEPSCVLPPSIQKNEVACELYKQQVDQAHQAYEKLVEMGVPREDARFILPHGWETRLVVSMNARELHHFFQIRLCRRAQWEIQLLARKMLALVKNIAPELFSSVGPGCLFKSGCTELKPCGRPFKKQEELLSDDL